MADATARINGIVNVTSEYPDPDHTVLGAAVLLDRKVGQGAVRGGFQRRPVFVVYTNAHAAEQAVRGRQRDTYLRKGARVIYLPPHFPAAVRATYERGLAAGLQ